ncbi:MAG TPA: FAD-dependent oxidoreductase, partial [bacterium]
MIAETDVVVIGAGVHGASAAYHLARAGKSVALLERRTIGSGSSGASGGIIRSHYSTRSMIRLAHRAATRWPALAGELGRPVDYVRNGLVVVVDADDASVMEEVVSTQRHIGVDTDTIPPQEISRWIPGFNTTGVALAAYEAQAGYADPYSSAVAFAQRARELG